MLTSLESALAALLDGLAPVEPALVPLAESLGRIAAEMPPQAFALPRRHTAAADGFALRAIDLAGASAYSPVALSAAPAWVEAGEAMPAGCDCVLDADLVDCSGPIAQALAEAAPGLGIRRAGEDVGQGRPVTLSGLSISPVDLLVLRNARLDQVAVRTPSVRVIDVASVAGPPSTAAFLLDAVRSRGSVPAGVEKVGRDIASIAAALDGAASDAIILVGGTGRGRTDFTAAALAQRRALIAHGIALLPGETAAVGRLGKTPVVALPGTADHAFSGFLALAQPLLDRLSGRADRQAGVLPLGRKISSLVGVAELALVKRERGSWMPLAVGRLSLDRMRLADAFLLVPAGSEGYAASTPVPAFPLRDMT